MPVCTHCHKEKGPAGFYKDARKTNGLTSWCKVCTNARSKVRITLAETGALAAQHAKRQAEITKYGIEVVEALDTMRASTSYEDVTDLSISGFTETELTSPYFES